MRPPRGLDELRAFYGDPRTHIMEDGFPSAAWASQMVTVLMPAPLPLGWDRSKHATKVRVHQAIAGEVVNIFEELKAGGEWYELRTYDGGYTWRLQRGGSKLSMHGYGGALDFDAPWNKLGMLPQMPRGVVRVFERRGWTWGGRWRRKDGMHFQFGRGY